MKYWAKINTHVHSLHSDGADSLLEIARIHKDMGFDGFYITDHNTCSAMDEAPEIEEKVGVAILSGVEYTTFHGHFISYGEGLLDWTGLDPESLEEFLEEMRRGGCLSAIAHYDSIGYPVCTGCRFEFDGEGTDSEILGLFDMMEVWHGERTLWQANHAVWKSLLDQGRRMTALAGIDSHDSRELKGNAFCNLLRIDPELPLKEGIWSAMAKGNLIMSLGESLEIRITRGGREYAMGDTVVLESEDREPLGVEILMHLPDSGGKHRPFGTYSFAIRSNRGCLAVHRFEPEQIDPSGCYRWKGEILPDPGLLWIHAELALEDVFSRETRAVGNPVYFAAAAP